MKWEIILSYSMFNLIWCLIYSLFQKYLLSGWIIYAAENENWNTEHFLIRPLLLHSYMLYVNRFCALTLEPSYHVQSSIKGAIHSQVQSLTSILKHWNTIFSQLLWSWVYQRLLEQALADDYIGTNYACAENQDVQFIKKKKNWHN